MKRMVFKLVSRRSGAHVKTIVFSGYEDETLVNTGELTQTLAEWQLFGPMLSLGADSSEAAKRRVKVIFEGDEEIVSSYDGQKVEQAI